MRQKGFALILIPITIVALAVVGFLVYSSTSKKGDKEPISAPFFGKEKEEDEFEVGVSWQEEGNAISGNVGDAEVVDLGGGKFRMYYTAAPEAGGQLEMFSSVSTDGFKWTKESGTRMISSTFPDIIKLADGKWRMYFQGDRVIRSATSTDGLTWTDEVDTRIDSNETGFNLDTVGAQSTVQINDGSYIMVYRGAENKAYGTKKLPSKDTQLFFYATSSDGLKFDKKGIAIDSRNDTFEGLLDGAEWVIWDNDELRLYFWGYKGVYYSVHSQGKFSNPILTFTKDPRNPYPPDVPCDPSLAKINGNWFMYYGQFPNGIYYATVNNK